MNKTDRDLMREVAGFNLSHQLDILTKIHACHGYMPINWLIENKHTAAQFEALKSKGYIRVFNKEDCYAKLQRQSGCPVVKVHIMRKKIAAGR